MFGSTERIAAIEAHIDKLRLERGAAESRARSLIQYGLRKKQDLDMLTQYQLDSKLSASKQALANRPPQSVAGWKSSQWSEWNVARTGEESVIRIGELVEQRSPDFTLPAYAPFIGGGKTIIVRGHGEQGLGLFQSLLVRTAVMLPHTSRFTLLDPAGNGLRFPMRRSLPLVRENSADVRQDLDGVVADIQRIIETYLTTSITSFEQAPAALRTHERFQFVFAADVPNRYDHRALEALESIANTGPAAGVYLFIHHNVDLPMPSGMSLNTLQRVFTIDVNQGPTSLPAGFDFVPDSAPPAALQEQLFQNIKSSPQQQVSLDWNDLVKLPEREWWQGSATQLIETPVGMRSGGGDLNFWFGERDDGRPCAHGMLGAMTGSGKSTLYHGIITGLTLRYSPNELRLYLVDGKDGVEFNAYDRLPHAEVVSMNTAPELSRSILTELIKEKERRNQMFIAADVASFAQYRRKGQPGGNLPRIVLMVDEYQELFRDDDNDVASKAILELAQQGRSAGIHMFLGSQHFGVPQMRDQPRIFGNIHLRMALQMTKEDISALTEFGPKGRALVAACDLPGKLVENDRGGDDSANVAGKVALLQPEVRDQVLRSLRERAATLPREQLPRTVIFHGREQPALLKNARFEAMLDRDSWPAALEMETFARRPVDAGGLDIADWFAAERPHVMWLGEKFSMHSEAAVIMRRRAAENMLLIGDNNAARYGMLAAAIASLCATTSPTDLRVVLLDRSNEGALWNSALPRVRDALLSPLGYPSFYSRDGAQTEDVIEDLLGDMERRKQLGEQAMLSEPSLFFIMTEPDKVEQLKRTEDAYGFAESPLGEKLLQVLVSGPALGIHSILSFSGLAALESIFDRGGLRRFRHRVGLQMSEDASFSIFGNRQAWQLQADGNIPICALYMNTESDRAVRFKAYSIDPSATSASQALLTQIDESGARLRKRGKPS